MKKLREKKSWRIRVRGPVGKALEHFCNTRLSNIDFDRLIAPYRYRTGPACGRDVLLWGRAVCCALQCLPYLEDGALLAEKVNKTVADMLSLQDENGAITAFPDHLQLQGLDIPGRRYVLKALLLAAAVSDAPEEIKNCCSRMTDQIITLVGPGKRSILYCGILGGLDSSALLDAAAGVYHLTGEERFLAFARYIADCGGSQQHDIFTTLGSGMAPSMLANGNAPGITRCFSGLAELGKVDPEYAEHCRELCQLYLERIAAEELFITGTGGGVTGAGDIWCRGAFQQTSPDCRGGNMGSTDVTAACIEFFDAVSGLIDPVLPFAWAERSFYNALLGAWDAEKACCAPLEPTPLTGCRRRPCPEPESWHDLLRGGEALSLFPRMAIQLSENSAVLNFYEEMEAHLSRKTLIRVTGGYPGSGKAHISIRSRHPFTISLRIPENCAGVWYCDCKLAWQKDSYLTITRPWEPDEILTIELDPEVRRISPPDGSPFQAFMKGPLVLAANVPGENVPEFMTETTVCKLLLRDFASAGRTEGVNGLFNVWLKKMIPDYLTSQFTADTYFPR